ncbi:putative potassium efflux transporter [Stanieria sp. NIES-3757]|nr:putative potassium efflux transporter [Stanieria sp. NIES-3757]
MAAVNDFVLELTTVLGSSALGGFIANRLRQPVLLGYLISGLIIGPFGFGLVQEIENIKSLAEIGVAFLLFTLGVEFSLTELKRVKDIAINGSLLQIGLTTFVVALVSFWLGWVDQITEAVFLGAILSLSSTAVVLKTLTERGETNTVYGQVMLAILIVQDLALGLMLAVLPALNEPSNLVMALLTAILKAVIFFTAAFVAGYWIIPPLIKTIAETENSELFLLAVLALCLGVALITASLGLSIEMGAFVAGLTISEIDYADQALAKILPLRDTFASLFFASIGMLIDPQILWQNLGVILELVILIMFGKAMIVFPIIWGFGYSFRTSALASLGLNQIGEFSFVLALVAFESGLMSRERYLLLLGTTAITLVLTPISMKFSPRLVEKLLNLPWLREYLRSRQQEKIITLPDTICNHVVVAGYGRVGQIIVKILRDRSIPVVVIDNSEAAIQRLRQEQIPYLFGDGDSDLVLEKAHLETAKALAIALPDPASTRILLKHALAFAPHLAIVARCHTNSEIDVLTQMGAKEVIQPEFEAALAMGAEILQTLGTTRNTIDAAIDEIRTDRYLSIRPELTLASLAQEIRKTASATHNQWLTISADSPLIGMTLASANIRQLTGVTVMSIQRNGETIYYPQADTKFVESDRLLVVGKRKEVALFQDLLQGNLSIRNIKWILLNETSPWVGMMVSQLEQQYGIKLEALRRQGKLLRSVKPETILETEDYLLISEKGDRFNPLQTQFD